jgi:hypothetical protein
MRRALIGFLEKPETHRYRRKPHERSKQQQTENGGRSRILDYANFDMVLGSDMIGESFNRRI